MLEKIAPTRAHRSLRADGAARLPFFVRLAAQKAGEDPHSFLAHVADRFRPARREAAAGSAATLRAGRLCLLADALNEAPRKRYDERAGSGSRSGATCPPAMPYFHQPHARLPGRAGPPAVEIDPLTDAD